MSHYRLKTKFKVEGPYGSEEEQTLYADHNLTCDLVSFYDEHGNYLFTVEDTMHNNLLDAINRLYSGVDLRGNLKEGVETWTTEDYNKLKH